MKNKEVLVWEKTEKPCGIPGDRYVPYEERTGNQSIVYFTRGPVRRGAAEDLRAGWTGTSPGTWGVKLHTGEKNGPNIIPREWGAGGLLEKDLPEASIIETNTYYQGDRYTTADHRETLKVNGWTFCPVDIMDAEGAVLLPVQGRAASGSAPCPWGRTLQTTTPWWPSPTLRATPKEALGAPTRTSASAAPTARWARR